MYECIWTIYTYIVSSWTYLGFYLSNAGHKLVFDPYEERKSFFRSSNCIINSLYKPPEEILMRLYFTNCVSIFTYGIEVKEYVVRDLSNIHIAMNDGIRKIFGWNRWESVRHLRSSFGYKDIYTMITLRKRKFFQSIPRLRNSLLSSLVTFIQLWFLFLPYLFYSLVSSRCYWMYCFNYAENELNTYVKKRV